MGRFIYSYFYFSRKVCLVYEQIENAYKYFGYAVCCKVFSYKIGVFPGEIAAKCQTEHVGGDNSAESLVEAHFELASGK